MPRAPWVGDAVYVAGERFVEECLRQDGSLFTPGRPIWTPGTLDDFHERFIVHEKTEGGSFMERLQEQLEGAPDETIQLTAEILFFNYLCEDDTKAETKRRGVSTVLGWMASPVAIPAELDAAFSSGLARIGLAKAQRWQQLRFLLEFMRTWKSLEPGRRDELLDDAWEFREFVQSLPKHSASVQIEGLLHLVFPEPFESIVSPNHKRDIVQAFRGVPGVDLSENVDRNIQVIRAVLTSMLGDDFTFYRSQVVSIWREKPGAWTEFLTWAERLYAAPEFDEAERGYKLEVAENVARARTALLGDEPDWPALVHQAYTAQPNNLTSWRDHEPFYRWCEESSEEAAAALRALWLADDPLVGLGSLLDALPEGLIEADGGRVAVTAFLLLGVDAGSFPPFRPDPVRQAYRLLERSPEESSGVERYSDFLAFLDELRVRLLAGGTETRDRLDAQSLAWWITSSEPPESWSEADKQAFLAYREGRSEAVVPEEDGDVRAWLVRGANNFGENMLPTWFAEDFVSIGWPNATQIDSAADLQEIRQHLRSASPEAREGEIIRGSGILRRFLDISPGDWIVTPDGDDLYVARATGAEYWNVETSRAALRRPVEWLNVDSPGSRAQLRSSASSLYDPLKTRLTVSDLTDYLDAVRSLVSPQSEVAAPVAASAIPAPGADLARRLYLGRAWLGDVVDMLNEKGQVIFYGPPGTGKTYVAQALGEHVERSGGSWRLVQFHPAYSYEDFFEGYRPEQGQEGGPLSFRLRHGPLREISEAARKAPDRPHLLVIDEINRGNIAKIFGELYFLLEYRERAIRLQYSPSEEFSLPRNLFFIGTMNTADRSIALVDSALRRRFYFVPFLPQESPVSDVLGAWLRDHGLNDEPARLLDELNRLLADRDAAGEEFAIGPSYFMTAGGAPDLERVWAHAVLPLLEERFYGALGRQEVATELGLEAVRASLAGEPEIADEADEEELDLEEEAEL